MDGKNSIYYEKYLKYKNKYLALKNKIGGNGNIHNRPCNTSIGYNQFYYNIFNLTKQALTNKDYRYRYWTGHLENYPNGCNLWVYREDVHDRNFANHLDIYVTNYYNSTISFGFTARKDGQPKFANYTTPNIDTRYGEQYIANILSEHIDGFFHNIWG